MNMIGHVIKSCEARLLLVFTFYLRIVCFNVDNNASVYL